MDFNSLLITAPAISGITFFVIAFYTFWHYDQLPAIPFGGAMLAYGIWTLGYSLELQPLPLENKIFLMQVRYLAANAFFPQLWLATMLAYTHQTHWLTPRKSAILSLLPLVIILIVLSSDYHNLFRSGYYIQAYGDVEILRFKNGVGHYVIFALAGLLNLFSSWVILGRSLYQATPFHARRTWLVISGSGGQVLAEIAYQLQLSPVPGYSFTPTVSAIVGICMVWALFRYQFLDLKPIAANLILNNLQDGIIVLDNQQRIVDINTTARAAIERPAEELIGTPLATLKIPWLTSIPKELNQVYLSDITLPNQRYLNVQIAPLHDTGSKQIGYTVSLRDITQRKQFEEQLRLQGAALESAANGIIITNRAGDIIWANPAFSAMTGYALDEILHRNPRFLKSGAQSQSFYKALWETILAGQVWRGEVINRRKDGTLYTDEQNITPIKNELGEITHFVGVRGDISERVRLEQLRQELVDMLVHDLRNPLASTQIALETLMYNFDDLTLTERDFLVSTARQNTVTILNLVNAILDMSRLERGELPLELVRFRLSDLVAEVLQTQLPLANQKRILLKNTIAATLPEISADQKLVWRMMQNLIGNAIKFTPENGTIYLTAQVADEKLQISIADTGYGIPANIQKDIFKKFVTGKVKGRGTGLGLAFCKLTIEAHGGEIWVESNEGKGSTFTFTLPVLPAYSSS
jgi:PAS domain S-box-containing protein